MKNWTGNSKSIHSPLGASNHSDCEREKNDYYATDYKTIKPLLDQLKKNNETLSSNLWECACGELDLSIELENNGYNVYSSDIVKRKYECNIVDFLKVNQTNIEKDIITNPPYKFAQNFVEKGLEIIADGCKVIMFLKLTFLEGQKRRKMFEKYPPKYIYVFSSRQKCAMNGDFKNTESSAACYCWMVWEKNFKGKPLIEWI